MSHIIGMKEQNWFELYLSDVIAMMVRIKLNKISEEIKTGASSTYVGMWIGWITDWTTRAWIAKIGWIDIASIVLLTHLSSITGRRRIILRIRSWRWAIHLIACIRIVLSWLRKIRRLLFDSGCDVTNRQETRSMCYTIQSFTSPMELWTHYPHIYRRYGWEFLSLAYFDNHTNWRSKRE